jgi:hypothetical protein
LSLFGLSDSRLPIPYCLPHHTRRAQSKKIADQKTLESGAAVAANTSPTWSAGHAHVRIKDCRHCGDSRSALLVLFATFYVSGFAPASS